MSESMFHKKEELELFLFNKVYRCKKVNITRELALKKIDKLFTYYLKNPKLLPNYSNWGRDSVAQDTEGLAIYVADYLAGMTDGFADRQVEMIQKIKDLNINKKHTD